MNRDLLIGLLWAGFAALCASDAYFHLTTEPMKTYDECVVMLTESHGQDMLPLVEEACLGMVQDGIVSE